MPLSFHFTRSPQGLTGLFSTGPGYPFILLLYFTVYSRYSESKSLRVIEFGKRILCLPTYPSTPLPSISAWGVA
jgi:hypothetical protein